MLKKIFAIMLILVLVANLVLFGLGKISGLTFWFIIIIGFVLNYLFKKSEIR